MLDPLSEMSLPTGDATMSPEIPASEKLFAGDAQYRVEIPSVEET